MNWNNNRPPSSSVHTNFSFADALALAERERSHQRCCRGGPRTPQGLPGVGVGSGARAYTRQQPHHVLGPMERHHLAGEQRRGAGPRHRRRGRNLEDGRAGERHRPRGLRESSFSRGRWGFLRVLRPRGLIVDARRDDHFVCFLECGFRKSTRGCSGMSRTARRRWKTARGWIGPPRRYVRVDTARRSKFPSYLADICGPCMFALHAFRPSRLVRSCLRAMTSGYQARTWAAERSARGASIESCNILLRPRGFAGWA